MSANPIKDRFSLEGKVAIVTGAGRGIGESIAKGLAEFGAKVVICGRSQTALDDVANQCSKLGYKVLPLACHVGDEAQLKSLVQATIDHFGDIHILVNNAATNPLYSSLEDVSVELFDKMMNINVKASFLLSNLCLPYLKSGLGRSIIHISSVEGIRPSEGLGMYSITKAALIMLAKSQAKEWGKYGIRSNVICPGLVQTKFSQSLWQNKELLDLWEQRIPLKRMAQPNEISGLGVFLASEASSYCTGMEFTADGGYLIA